MCLQDMPPGTSTWAACRSSLWASQHCSKISPAIWRTALAGLQVSETRLVEQICTKNMMQGRRLRQVLLLACSIKKLRTCNRSALASMVFGVQGSDRDLIFPTTFVRAPSADVSSYAVLTLMCRAQIVRSVGQTCTMRLRNACSSGWGGQPAGQHTSRAASMGHRRRR